MPLNLTWKTCGDDGHWCSLEALDLDSVGETAGVYIIWHEGNPGRVVRIGQGDPIQDRLSAHRNDPKVTKYRSTGKLRVTWASVSSIYRDGVERHLANLWNPLVGDAFPNVLPIAVNSPW
jgi:hypothetical protein